MNIVFLAKTNLNNDGRILNQIKILQNYYQAKLNIDFILLPDKPLIIDLGENIKVHSIDTSFRNSSLLRSFTVIQFTWLVLMKLFKLKPKIVHVEDMAVVLPVYIYRLFKGRSFKLIYDDHEMPNENESKQYRILQYFEVKLMKKSDYVIFANQERMEIIRDQHNLINPLTYFLNLPYFEHLEIKSSELSFEHIITDLQEEKARGIKFIIHQGLLEIERGREKLANFSHNLPENIKILIIGISKTDFDNFILEYNLNSANFYFVGSVPYNILNSFWKVGDAAIVMYLPTYINNRLCAPNRFYIAVQNQLPILVNRDNPVLNNFIKEYHAGFFIEDICKVTSLDVLLSHSYKQGLMESLIQSESEKLIDLYENI